jgi:hypothetical protein
VGLKVHPVAALFPLLEGVEFEQLVESIKTDGLLEAIWIWRGQLVEGRNRERACEAADVKPRYRELEAQDEAEVVRFILAKNVRRRHLTASQRAMLANNLRPYYEAAAKERQREAGGDKKSADAQNPRPEFRAGDDRSERTDHRLASLFAVGHDLVSRAHKIAQSSPELAKEVLTGAITVNAAYAKIKEAETADDTEADDTEADETEANETKANETKADETEANETKADETEANETKAEETEAKEKKEDETEAHGVNGVHGVHGVDGVPGVDGVSGIPITEVEVEEAKARIFKTVRAQVAAALLDTILSNGKKLRDAEGAEWFELKPILEAWAKRGSEK